MAPSIHGLSKMIVSHVFFFLSLYAHILGQGSHIKMHIKSAPLESISSLILDILILKIGLWARNSVTLMNLQEI